MTAIPSSTDSVKGSSNEDPKSLHTQDNPYPGGELALAAIREVVRTELREEALRMGSQRQHERQFSKGGGDETWL